MSKLECWWAEPLFNVVGGGEDGGIFPCSPERRDDCLCKIGGSEGLLTEKVFFTVADLRDLRPTEADLLRVCHTVPCGWCKIGGSEGLLITKLSFTEADLLYLLRVCAMEADLLDLLLTEADLLHVCRTGPCGRFALLLLALQPPRIISEGGMTPREDGGCALMTRQEIG